MTVVGGKPTLDLTGNTLVARGRFSPFDTTSFERALWTLLDTGSPEPTLDLTGLENLSSTIVGQVARVGIESLSQGRLMTIVADRALAQVLRASAIDKFCSVKVRQ
jgi:hypothetical protein